MRRVRTYALKSIMKTTPFLLMIIGLLAGCGAEVSVQQEENPESAAEAQTAGAADMAQSIDVFTQSSIRIQSSLGVIYLDPFQMEIEPHDADFILITHDHYDHFSPEDIEKVRKESTVMIVPESMADEAVDLAARIETVAPGARYTVDGLTFDTVPAYNNETDYHPKDAGWVGYILTIDGQRIYIAGDTDVTEENKLVSCDIALIPIGGTYTMDPKEAAGLINTIRPAVAIPTHYGSIVGTKEDADVFASMVEPPVQVAVKIR